MLSTPSLEQLVNDVSQYVESYLQSSIFNASGGTSIQLDGQILKDKKIDLLTIDPLVGTDEDLINLMKILNRKDMHLIIDLPLSTTLDPSGFIWYGSDLPFSTKIKVKKTTIFEISMKVILLFRIHV